MTGLLADRVTAYVADHPGCTVGQVALAISARRVSVQEILAFGLFRAEQGPRGAQVYTLAPVGVLRRPTGRASQCDLIAAVLADGRWHTAAEIHQRCGFSRLNSRVAELRKRGLAIVCEHVKGAGLGAAAYRYRLLLAGGREEDDVDAAAVPAEAAVDVASSSSGPLVGGREPGRPDLTTPSGPARTHQLTLPMPGRMREYAA